MVNPLTVAPTKHATLGASAAHRWMNCPGSVRLSALVPQPPSSPQAREGTVAHDIAARALVEGKRPEEFLNVVVRVDDEEITVTEEMVDGVAVYVDHVNRLRGPDMVFVEQEVNLGPLNPPVPMFGTADAIVWNPADKILHVCDFKYGRGVIVDPNENPQGMYYALGAVLHLRVKPAEVWFHIVQPRAGEEPIRYVVWTWDDILGFRAELMSAADRTQLPDAPLVIGEHCRWCPAKAQCPAQQEMAVAVACAEFDSPPPAALPDASLLTKEELLRVLEHKDYIQDWLSSVAGYVHGLLESGEEVPGWKLVAKRATRRWKDPEEAEKWLRRKLGAKVAYKKTVLSPAQAEKEAKNRDVDFPEEKLVEKYSSGTNLVRADNPKPSITGGDEFTVPIIEE